MNGVVLGDRYKIIRKLGAGGMAEVFLADDLQQKIQVAVKIMPPSTVSENEFVRRFRREFAVCSSLNHPNIVKLFSCGRTPDDSSWYYAMELLACQDLEELLKERGTLKSAYVMQIVLQLARGFKHYHIKGVVHRDLKPANIMIEKNGRVVIMDFGLVHDPSMTQLTKTGTIMGTPQYMSPELLCGEKSDPRSDIFQLGSIIHECLCGKPAFPGSTVPEVGAKIMYGRYVHIRTVDPSISADWETFLINCLGTERDERYQDADALLKDLQKMMIGDTIELLCFADEEADDANDMDNGGAGTGQAGSKKGLRQGGSRKSGLKGKSGIRKGGSRRNGKNVTDTDPQLFKSSGRLPGQKTAIDGPDDGRLSSKSFIDNPDNVKRSRMIIMGVAGLIICLVFGSIFYTLFLKTNYDAYDIQVISGVGTFAITWSSKEPYPSVVSVLHKGKEVKVIHGTSQDGETDHIVEVSSLEMNAKYTGQIVYPGNVKGPMEIVTTLQPQITIVDSLIKNGKLTFRWKVVPVGDCKVWVKRINSGASTVYEAKADHESYSITIDDSPVTIESLTIEVHFDDEATYKTKVSESLASELSLLSNKLRAFDMKKFRESTNDYLHGSAALKLNENILIKRMGESDTEFKIRKKSARDETNDSEERNRNIGKRKINSLLTSNKVYPAYKKSVKLSPLILGTSIIKKEAQYRFYGHMNDYLRYYAYSNFFDLDVLALKPLADLGLFQVRICKKKPAGPGIETINLMDKLPTGQILKIGGQKLWDKNPTKVHAFNAQFNIDNLSIFSRAEFFFDVVDWEDVGLIISINSQKPEIWAFNHPKITPTLVNKENISMGVPLDMLKKGQNTISFTQSGLFERLTRDDVKLRGLFLVLYK